MLKVWDIAAKKVLFSITVFDDDRYIAFTAEGRYTGTVDIGRQAKVTYLDGAAARNVLDEDRKALFVPSDRFASVAGLN